MNVIDEVNTCNPAHELPTTKCTDSYTGLIVWLNNYLSATVLSNYKIKSRWLFWRRKSKSANLCSPDRVKVLTTSESAVTIDRHQQQRLITIIVLYLNFSQEKIILISILFMPIIFFDRKSDKRLKTNAIYWSILC